MTAHRTLLPPGWPRPRGYANGIVAEGRTVWTGGLIGWDENERFVEPGLVPQFGRVLRSTLAILAEAGAGPEHIVRMTWYIVSRDEYVDNLAAVGALYRKIMGRNYPTMAVVVVAGLIEPAARVEIETTAVLPAA